MFIATKLYIFMQHAVFIWCSLCDGQQLALYFSGLYCVGSPDGNDAGTRWDQGIGDWLHDLHQFVLCILTLLSTRGLCWPFWIKSSGQQSWFKATNSQLDFICIYIYLKDIDGLVQERCKSIAAALELCLSCTNLSICSVAVSIYCSQHCACWCSSTVGG